MKKKIVGVASAALILGSSIGYAASASLIGAKVTGVFSVQQNGKKIADAVIINGSTYAPIRAISEATGTDITVRGKSIILGSKSAATTEPDTTVAEPIDLKAMKARLESEMEKKMAHISDLEKNVIPPLESMAKELSNSGTIGEDRQKSADEYNALLAKRKKELAFLQAELIRIKTLLGE